MQGTHPALIEALEPHEKKLKALTAQADRLRQLEIGNINAHHDYEKQQPEDENRAQLEFFKSRLIDSIEEKRKKNAGRSGNDTSKKGTSDKSRKRPLVPTSSCLPAGFALLKPDELKADLEEINTNVDHYSVRSAAGGAGSADAAAANTTDAYFDRQRQQLNVNGLGLERGQSVYVYMQGQRVDDTWQVHAMNAVEVTLRDAEGTKLKVTLAQLRNGRYAFRLAPGGGAGGFM